MTVAGRKTPLVRDVMTRDLICVRPYDSLKDVAAVFGANEISGAPVVDAGERLIGVVTKTDIIEVALAGPIGSRPGSFFSVMSEGLARGTDLDPDDLGAVEDFMSTDPVTATVNEPIGEVAARMADHKIHRVVVVDDQNRPIGMVTSLDVLKSYPG